MKKTLLATAIAGAMAASGAQAATVYNQDGTKLDIYGNIQLGYKSVETRQGDGSVESEDEVYDVGSTFGFMAEHVIYDGLTGYLKLEFDDFKADEQKVAGRDTGDTAYIGARGNFGDVRLGSYDPLIDDWIQDPISNNEWFDLNDSSSEGISNVGTNDREGDKLTYTSPVFSGFQFALGTQYKGDAEETEFGDVDEDTNVEVDADSNASFFGGVKYTAGAFSIAAAYDDLDNYDGDVVSAGAEAAGGVAAGDDFELGDQYGVTAQYTIDSLRLSAKYEVFDAEADNSDIDFMALGARYGYGMGDVYGAYQNVDYDDSSKDDRDEVNVGVTYTISDAMYTWAEAAWYDKEDDVDDGVGVGITYLF